MSDDSSVLSQAEIDALFRQATGTSISRPAPAAAPVAPPAATIPVPPAPAAPVRATAPTPVMPQPLPQTRAAPTPATPVPPVQAKPATSIPVPKPAAEYAVRLADDQADLQGLITEQQSQLNDLFERIGKIESTLQAISHQTSSGGTVKSPLVQKQLNDLNDTVKRIVKQTAGIQKGLNGTPAYNLAHEFTCSECGAQGHLAVPVTCTHCGKEGWWGWWPNNPS